LLKWTISTIYTLVSNAMTFNVERRLDKIWGLLKQTKLEQTLPLLGIWFIPMLEDFLPLIKIIAYYILLGIL
jgi:hypothetical protein